ncbi:MAG: (deoxy)nucleoside triphosphate pyrophosphohydrolase [Rhodospirillaceae bacterium]
MTRTVTVVACALINPEGLILLTQRPAGKAMAGLWEFPGGKIEANESPETALCRELWEELHITVSASDLAPLTFVSHAYDTFQLIMPLYLCRQWKGNIVPQENQETVWIKSSELRDYPMPPADLPLIPILESGI